MTDKMREEFEVSVLSEYPNQNMGRFATGDYQSTTIEHCWWAWKKSREVLVIEWPDRHTYTIPDCAGAAILDCRTAFSKAVKVKP